MDNLQNNNMLQHRGTLNGQEGTWVPVESSEAPFQVSNDPQNPSVAPDGSCYYSQTGSPQSANEFAPIAANQYNAIPTPSNIVQLPPIVQPIALVPFASQNQPMVQYDPNYREEIPKTNLEPIYRPKPYSGLSVFCIFLAVAILVVGCLVECLSVGASALDSVFGLLTEFGIEGMTSVYFAEVIKAGDSMALIVPIAYLASLVIAFVMVIYYLVKLAKRVSPRHFSVATLVGLVLALVALIMTFVMENVDPSAGAYIIVVLYVVLFIAPFFARKGAQVIDYEASRRLIGSNTPERR